MKSPFVFLSVLLLISIQTQGEAISSANCFEFFYVKRPVALGVVEHEFVAAENIETQEAEAFGLLKGSEDLSLFIRARRGSQALSASLSSLGVACGQKAEYALQVSREYSKSWTEYYKSWTLYLIRMGIKPVLGKPCRNTALAISKLVAPYLAPSSLE